MLTSSFLMFQGLAVRRSARISSWSEEEVIQAVLIKDTEAAGWIKADKFE